jgi:AcrR family transcriptional regulator
MNQNDQALAAKIVTIARSLIHETGDFDLSMRDLAARAQVSLRTPYKIFGSKSGVINAILMSDQKLFRTLSARLNSTDEIENIFDRIRLGIGFYAANQAFYRALFRATQGYDGKGPDQATENLRSFQILSQRASRAGLIRSEIDTMLLGEILSDLFAENVRRWARGSFDIDLVDLKLGFGFAAVLSSVAVPSRAPSLAQRMLEFQNAISAFRPGSARAHVAA